MHATSQFLANQDQKEAGKGKYFPKKLNTLYDSTERGDKTAAKEENPGMTLSDHFFVRSEHKQVRIEIQKILYIEGMRDYVKIFLEDKERPILTLMSLKSLEFQLKNLNFLRIHKSYIANLNKVTQVQGFEVCISSRNLPLAQRIRKKAIEILNTNN